MSVAVKICGITDRESLHAAVEGGAAYIGFVLIPTSKRYISVKAAQELLATLPQPTLCRFTKASATNGENDLVLTALFQDPTDEQIEGVMALRPFLGLIQLHGNETPERVAAIRQKTDVPVMKVFAIATAQDFTGIPAYDKVADMYLFDTKVGNTPTGGTGKSFDWTLLTGRSFTKPWMLAGGLKIDNVVKAVEQSGAKIVDVSSGVETKGKKDPTKIRAFLRLCHGL